MIQANKNQTKNQEQRLVDIIDRTAKLINTAESTLKQQDFKIVMLIGDTGSGKSTIFNLLCGAEFEIEAGKNKDELKIKKGTKNYSLMKSGTNSITKEPIYFYNEKYKHLMIDFPGFKDTEGELDQLVIQLLFNKIISSKKIKLIYIIQQSLFDLPNRGAFIQEFIDEFSQQQVKFHQCLLIVNSFSLEENTEQQVVEEERKQLLQITKDKNYNHQQIFVVRYINKKRINSIPQLYKQLWEKILLALELEFRPFKIEKTKTITNYITQACRNFIYVPCSEIQRVFQNQLTHLSEQQINKILSILSKATTAHSKLLIDQFKNIQITLELLNNELKGTVGKMREDTQRFTKIFLFFYDYKSFIDGFENCKTELQQTVNTLQTLEVSLRNKLKEFEKQREYERQQQRERIQMEQKLEAQRQQMLEEMERIKQQEAQERERQIEQIRKEAAEKEAQMRRQIQQNNQSSGSGCQLI